MEKVLTGQTRVVFLSSGGILGDAVLRQLLESGKFDVKGIVRSRRVMLRGAGFLRGAAAYFMRCGIIYTVYIWTITTFAEFVGLFTKTGSITRRAKQRGIPILHTQNVNNPQGREFLARCEPDLLISAHFDQKLDSQLCDGPGRAAVNIHPSLLPEHRGLEPVLHAMVRQESAFGVTVHRIAADIDTGAILAAKEIKTDPRESVLRVMLNLAKSGANLLAASAKEAQSPGVGAKQTGEGCYHSWPTGRDIGQLYRSGRHLMRPRDFTLFWKDS
jgi:methionyl-tRNA formyltransferase